MDKQKIKTMTLKDNMFSLRFHITGSIKSKKKGEKMTWRFQ